jgi:CBS-domain-containing membrane protein
MFADLANLEVLVPQDSIRYIVKGDGTALLHRAHPLQKRRSDMKVKEAMHKGVDWVGPDTPVTDLAKLMCKHDIGAIPIGENDQLIGMVTDRDIVCKGLAEDSFDARRATARDVMTPGIHCCREDDDLAKAGAAHGGAEGPQVAGDQQEQADGPHPQSGRRQPFGTQ